MGPVVYSAKFDEDLFQHNVVYEENGHWYKTKWIGPYVGEKPEYPVDELEEGILIPEEDYTIPYQPGWTMATPELVEREDIYVKRPLLPYWTEDFRELMPLKILPDVLAWEAIKHLQFPGPGHTYLGVVVQNGRVHGIALRKYVTTLELAIRGPDRPVEMVFYTPSQVFHHVRQAVEALHAVNVVHGDIDATNIMLDHGRHPWLIDLDSAATVGEKLPITGSHFDELNQLDRVASTYVDLYCLSKLEDDLLETRVLHTTMYGFDLDLRHCDSEDPFPDAPPAEPFHQSSIHLRKTKSIPKIYTVLVILLDEPVDFVMKQHGNYHDIVTSWLRRSMVTLPQTVGDAIVNVKSFDAFKENWHKPSSLELEGADALFIVGTTSKLTAQEPSLARFIKEVQASYPNLKVLATGAGHHALCEGLGGHIENCSSGRQAGMATTSLNTLGEKMLLAQKSSNDEPSITLAQLHDRILVKPPKNFASLDSSASSTSNILISPETAASLAEVQVISLAYHPEFTVSSNIAILNIIELQKRGEISEERAEIMKTKAALPEDGLRFGRIILSWITDGFTDLEDTESGITVSSGNKPDTLI